MMYYRLDTLNYHVAQLLAADVDAPGHEGMAGKFNLYTYKSLDFNAEAPRGNRPFIHIGPTKAPAGIQGWPAGAAQDQALHDTNSVAITIQVARQFGEGGQTRGGYDALLVPVVKLLWDWLTSTPGLEIPTALHSVYRAGNISMTIEQPGQRAGRFTDYEQHMFWLRLGEFRALYKSNP